MRVHGDWIPRHIAHRGHILFSHLRNVALALMVGLFGPRCDVYVCDQVRPDRGGWAVPVRTAARADSGGRAAWQVSSCIPVLRLLCPRSRVIFYCHFPDQLLARHDTLLKRLYRLPFDVLEEVTTGMADEILVNSAFTRGVFQQTFRLLRSWNPKLLYPTIRIPPMSVAPRGGRAQPHRLTRALAGRTGTRRSSCTAACRARLPSCPSTAMSGRKTLRSRCAPCAA